jgi:hypothetical protein
MTMTVTGKTGPEAVAPGIAAAREMHAKFVAAGDAKAAKLVAAVSNLFANVTFPEAKADEPATVNSAEIEGKAIDLSGMTTTEAEEYQAYVAELDGTARRERHIADLVERDEEDRRIGAFHDGS